MIFCLVIGQRGILRALKSMPSLISIQYFLYKKDAQCCVVSYDNKAENLRSVKAGILRGHAKVHDCRMLFCRVPRLGSI